MLELGSDIRPVYFAVSIPYTFAGLLDIDFWIKVTSLIVGLLSIAMICQQGLYNRRKHRLEILALEREASKPLPTPPTE